MSWETALITGAAGLLGGAAQADAARDAAASQARGAERARLDVIQARNEAQQAMLPLFDLGQSNALAGFQSAADIFGQAYPQQQQVMQQGNVAAQQAILGGLPAMNAAILGQPVDLSGLQVTQLGTPTLDFTMPQFGTASDALANAGVNLGQASGHHGSVGEDDFWWNLRDRIGSGIYGDIDFGNTDYPTTPNPTREPNPDEQYPNPRGENTPPFNPRPWGGNNDPRPWMNPNPRPQGA